MSTPSGVSHTSHTNSSNVIMDGLREVHDKGFGIFKGMVTCVLDLAKPYTVKGEKIYVENQRLANTVAAIVAVGALCYAPWSLICTVVPTVYISHRVTLSSNASSAESPAAIARSAIGDNLVASAHSISKGSRVVVPIAGRGSISGVSKETMETVIKLMKIFIAILEVALEIRDTAVNGARENVRYLTRKTDTSNGEPRIKLAEDTGEKECQLAGLRKQLSGSHFKALLGYLLSNYREFDTAISTGGFVVGRLDYEHIAKYFLDIVKSTGGDLDELDSKQVHCLLLNELIQGWDKQPATATTNQEGITDLLGEDCRIFYQKYCESEGRVRNAPAPAPPRGESRGWVR